MDIYDSIMDIHNCIMGKYGWVVLRENVSRRNLHLVQERLLKFQYVIIAAHNAIKDMHN